MCLPFLRALSILEAIIRLPFLPDMANCFRQELRALWSSCSSLNVSVNGQCWGIIQCSSSGDGAIAPAMVLLSGCSTSLDDALYFGGDQHSRTFYSRGKQQCFSLVCILADDLCPTSRVTIAEKSLRAEVALCCKITWPLLWDGCITPQSSYQIRECRHQQLPGGQEKQQPHSKVASFIVTLLADVQLMLLVTLGVCAWAGSPASQSTALVTTRLLQNPVFAVILLLFSYCI